MEFYCAVCAVSVWADMNAATPLGAWGRSVISLVCLTRCERVDPRATQPCKFTCRAQYHANFALLDDVVGIVTRALKAKGMWSNTLMIVS